MLLQVQGLAVAVMLAANPTTQAQAASIGSGQAYPQRPIRMIAAQSAGSSLDTILRIFTAKMTEMLGQQIVIDNRGSAGGTIGVELAAHAPADGYTLKEQFAIQGLAPAASESPEEMRKMIREDYARIAKLVKAAGIKAE